MPNYERWLLHASRRHQTPSTLVRIHLHTYIMSRPAPRRDFCGWESVVAASSSVIRAVLESAPREHSPEYIISSKQRTRRLSLCRWTRWFYLSTCQSTRSNGYAHLQCSREDYELVQRDRTDRSGTYWTASETLPRELELNTTDEVPPQVQSSSTPCLPPNSR